MTALALLYLLLAWLFVGALVTLGWVVLHVWWRR
jgi:hypothetical protein